MIRLPMFRPIYRTRYRVLPSLDVLAPYRRQHSWDRMKLPIYGTAALNIPGQRVDVPWQDLKFLWENTNALPQEIPQISLRPTRSVRRYEALKLAAPDLEMVVRTAPKRRGGELGSGRGPVQEYHRRRRDDKLTLGFRRAYRLLHKIDRPSEYLEFITTVRQNWDLGPIGIATALALNEATDYKYGARGRFLRDRVYRSDYWNLPVGYDTLSHLWRHF